MALKKIKMFAGKGGVGKTSCASATALHYAMKGEKTLIMSTDPTPSLAHIFEVMDKQGQKPIPVLDNLWLSELGFEQIKQMWDKKFGRELYEVFSSFVKISYNVFADFMISILPGLGEEFIVDFIKEISREAEYQHIVWDTAPLGQTLSLLESPEMLRAHLRLAPQIYSRFKLGVQSKRPIIEIIEGWAKLSVEDMLFLRNNVDFTLVTIAEALAVEQLDDVFLELEKHQFHIQQLLINNVIKKIGNSGFLKEKAHHQEQYLETIHKNYSHLQIIEIPLFSHEIKGLQRLKLLEKCIIPD